MNGHVGDGALALVSWRGDANGLARALTTLRVGVDLLSGYEADRLPEPDLRRLLGALDEATERVTDLMTHLVARTGSADA